MSAELFDSNEMELINMARLVLTDGLARLKSRKALFPTSRSKRDRAERAEVMEARNALTDYLVVTYGGLRHEVAAVALIDAQGRLIAVEQFPQGEAHKCEIKPRILADYCIKSGAVACVLCHNHPSGTNQPSKADIDFTHTIGPWLAGMDVVLLDHLVITVDGASAILGGF